MMDSNLNIAGFIDHTLLRPDATGSDIERLCNEALEYGFHSVCVYPSFIKKARSILTGSRVSITTVTGFPFGMTESRVKVYEAIESVLAGADELDIVMNTGRAKAGDWDYVEKEISDLVSATPKALHKIIIETCYLSDDEKEKATSVSIEAGAEFIKTSTGFGPSGATLEDVKLLKNVAGDRAGIKAAGGIKRLQEALAFINAGATRIGTSSGVEIIKESMER